MIDIEPVLVFCGKPPEHLTPLTTAVAWLHCGNRFMKRAVDFDQNDKVINVG